MSMASIYSGLLFGLQGAKSRFMGKRAAILCLSITCGLAAQTKPNASSDRAQEAAIVEQRSTRVHYENDGTGVVEHTEAIRIQSEAGIQRYGQLIFGYSSATEKLDVNYVRVRKPNGQTVETPAANAQDLGREVLGARSTSYTSANSTPPARIASRCGATRSKSSATALPIRTWSPIAGLWTRSSSRATRERN